MKCHMVPSRRDCGTLPLQTDPARLLLFDPDVGCAAVGPIQQGNYEYSGLFSGSHSGKVGKLRDYGKCWCAGQALIQFAKRNRVRAEFAIKFFLNRCACTAHCHYALFCTKLLASIDLKVF